MPAAPPLPSKAMRQLSGRHHVVHQDAAAEMRAHRADLGEQARLDFGLAHTAHFLAPGNAFREHEGVVERAPDRFARSLHPLFALQFHPCLRLSWR
jgi:hypothetical protein